MFIESGAGGPWEPDEEPAGRGPIWIPWKLIGWSAVVLWLFAASLVTQGIVAAALAWIAVVVASWRGSRLLGSRTGGLRDYKQ
jgi:hypothetical protein